MVRMLILGVPLIAGAVLFWSGLGPAAASERRVTADIAHSSLSSDDDDPKHAKPEPWYPEPKKNDPPRRGGEYGREQHDPNMPANRERGDGERHR